MSHRHTIFFLILLSMFIVLDIYIWLGYRKTVKEKYFKYFKWLIPLSTLFFIVGGLLNYFRNQAGLLNASKPLNILFGISLSFIVIKLMLAAFLFVEDLYRSTVLMKNKLIYPKNKVSLASRRKFVRNISLGAATIPLLGAIYATTKGKYAFHEKNIDLTSPRFPASFNGFKVVMFSDFHAGSFDDFEQVKRGLEIINEAQPDVILFAGDIVNNRSVEVLPYLSLFKNLTSKYGKFAVLGNHDYGDYMEFDSDEEKIENTKILEQFFEDAGFQLLNNKNSQITNGTDTLNIIGVENWGTGPFPQHGNIKAASEGINKEDFNILISHDPDHWEYEVRHLPEFYDLTLSGHTHGFQTGVSIPGWKWSLAKYRYKRWLGLYQEDGRYLFVSKGFGFLGFPGRIGMTPEIVIINLYHDSV